VKKKASTPPVLIVSGGQELLRRRLLNQMMATQRDAGWTIVNVDGSHPGEVRDALDGDVFGSSQTLVVVHNPEKVSLEMLEQHRKVDDPTVTLLLYIEGEPDGRTKFGKLVKTWGDIHKNFPLPSEWDAPKAAEKFLQDEFKSKGLTVTSGLAMALVERVGSDFGMLAFEADKIATLAKLDKSPSVEGRHIRGGMAAIAEASVFPIVDALAARSSKKLVKALAEVRRTSKDDPTIRVSRLIGSSVTKWFQAIFLDSLPPKAAAQELGINPWYFENKVLPAAQRWGKAGMVRLIADLAASERAVFNGALDPWVVLCTRLLSSCLGVVPQKKVVVLSPPMPSPVTPPPAPVVVSMPEVVLPPMPLFFTKTDDQAVVVPVIPEWVENSRLFNERMNVVRRKQREQRGYTSSDDDFDSKVVEYAVEHWLRTQHQFPPAVVDIEVREGGNAGWEPDLVYHGTTHIHCKSTVPDGYQFGYSATLQWSNRADQPTREEVRSGMDDLFRRTHGARWVQDDKLRPSWAEGPVPAELPKRLIIKGTPDKALNTYLALGVWDRTQAEVRLHFLQEWGYLLAHGLVERTYKYQCGKSADPKAAVYLTNIRYTEGLVEDPVDTTRGWMSDPA